MRFPLNTLWKTMYANQCNKMLASKWFDEVLINGSSRGDKQSNGQFALQANNT